MTEPSNDNGKPRSRNTVTSYPFEPKSNARLEPGQFWSIPLSDGRYGCGRVLAIARTADAYVPTNTRAFLAGLLDWVNASPPTAESIAGARVLRQGFVHVLAIQTTGRHVLGSRPLELDGATPLLWVTEFGLQRAWVYEGIRPLRRAEPTDAQLPIMETWGYDFIRLLAERAFVERASIDATPRRVGP